MLPPIDAQLVSLLNRKVSEMHIAMQNMGSGKVVEPRLLNPITYAILSEADDNLIRKLLLDEVASCSER